MIWTNRDAKAARRLGRWTRRDWMESLAGFAAIPLALGAQTDSRGAPGRLSMPGMYRGRVVRVDDARSIVSGAYQAPIISAMIERGMRELTGAPDATAAWRTFFEKGDVVGIKLNPVGGKLCSSDASVVRAIVAGLESAGVGRKDIVAYDRYRDQFFDVGFDKWLPEGVRMSSAAAQYDDIQQGMEGYDDTVFVDLALTLPGYDLKNERARRSYAARFITREVNKLINVPLLKDHQSAGVTLALKNLSHGLVNNVSRSHSSKSLNACGAFIPAVVSLPVIRDKAVLHVLDGVKGVYHGGPFGRPQFIWEHRALYFATDPVALDRIGWEEIDQRRLSVGKPRLVEDRPDEFSTFVHRQPEHVEIAGALGLGEWDRAKIDLRRIRLG